MFIKEVNAREINDSRGEKTIEVTINGCSASSPSGKSTGKYETPCYNKSLNWDINAVKNLKELFLIEINGFEDLKKVEKLLVKKFKLKKINDFGANALFALESAILKALARSQGKKLWEVINPNAKKIPLPLGNVVGGGLHSSCSPNLTFQEFLLSPQNKSAKENYLTLKRIHNKVGKITKSKKMNDEGAWETKLNEEQVLELLSKFKNVKIGVDVAASSFFNNGQYNYSFISLDKKSQIEFINSLIRKFNLLYVEDPLHEEDFSGFSKIKKKNLIVGDDLTVTHFNRLKKAIKSKSINGIIVKPNQNGSLLQVKELCDFCKKNNIKIIVSHRSGETLDSALTDYAVAFGADYIKCGIATKWREAKLERLVEIEKEINNK